MEQTSPTPESAPAPPPRRRGIRRRQWNVRAREDLLDVLQGYAEECGTQQQDLIDQMIAEYLERRGLWPPNGS